ncbi:alpha/beta hydrolase [Gordonia sp. DT30]|uniref:alpha/beta hydrolase n=1 Tax=unclassified Gordonia (in: high G+C Gram-positive bacteria) TaxID=2657482 RepID=UPI003CF6E428
MESSEHAGDEASGRPANVPSELDGPPAVRAAWWSSLSGAERAQFRNRHPGRIGNSDGIAAPDRDLANRAMLPRVLAELEQQRQTLTERLSRKRFRGTFTSDDARRWYVERKIADIGAIEWELGRADAANPRLLISFDMHSGERGHAAVAVGNPDTADHIGVTTPGLGTTIAPSLTGELPYQGMGGESRLLREETRRQLGVVGRADEAVAAVAWIGYDTPNFTGPGGRISTARGALHVATAGKARDTAPILSRFLAGLVAASDRRPHLVALGHSYGSLVTAEALRLTHGLVDDAIFYGSPGLGGDRGFDLDYTPASFHLVDGAAYVLKNDDDQIADLGLFGSDPVDSPALIRLTTRAGVDTTGVARVGSRGHATYSRDVEGKSTMAQYNMAAVLGRMPEHLITGP